MDGYRRWGMRRRGNRQLVLKSGRLRFFMLVSKCEIDIPLGAIVGPRRVRTYRGKALFRTR